MGRKKAPQCPSEGNLVRVWRALLSLFACVPPKKARSSSLSRSSNKQAWTYVRGALGGLRRSSQITPGRALFSSFRSIRESLIYPVGGRRRETLSTSSFWPFQTGCRAARPWGITSSHRRRWRRCCVACRASGKEVGAARGSLEGQRRNKGRANEVGAPASVVRATPTAAAAALVPDRWT